MLYIVTRQVFRSLNIHNDKTKEYVNNHRYHLNSIIRDKSILSVKVMVILWNATDSQCITHTLRVQITAVLTVHIWHVPSNRVSIFALLKLCPSLDTYGEKTKMTLGQFVMILYTRVIYSDIYFDLPAWHRWVRRGGGLWVVYRKLALQWGSTLKHCRNQLSITQRPFTIYYLYNRHLFKSQVKFW